MWSHFDERTVFSTVFFFWFAEQFRVCWYFLRWVGKQQSEFKFTNWKEEFKTMQQLTRSYFINCRIFTMQSSGLLQQWKSQNLPRKPPCHVESSVRPFTLNDIHGVFYALTIGLLIAAACMVLENLQHALRGQYTNLGTKLRSILSTKRSVTTYFPSETTGTPDW